MLSQLSYIPTLCAPFAQEQILPAWTPFVKKRRTTPHLKRDCRLQSLIAIATWTLQEQPGHVLDFRAIAGRGRNGVSRLLSISAFKGRPGGPWQPLPGRRAVLGHARAGPQRSFAKASWTLLSLVYALPLAHLLESWRYSPSRPGLITTSSGGTAATPRLSSRLAGRTSDASAIGAAPCPART